MERISRPGVRFVKYLFHEQDIIDILTVYPLHSITPFSSFHSLSPVSSSLAYSSLLSPHFHRILLYYTVPNNTTPHHTIHHHAIPCLITTIFDCLISSHIITSSHHSIRSFQLPSHHTIREHTTPHYLYAVFFTVCVLSVTITDHRPTTPLITPYHTTPHHTTPHHTMSLLRSHTVIG